MKFSGGLAILLLAGCVSPGATVARDLRPSVDWVANSAAWKSEAESVFRAADSYISDIARTYPELSWAVVLDLDETVLNNVDYQISLDLKGKEYPFGWNEWIEAQSATLVPGSKEFIQSVNNQGGHVVFVTNRRDIYQLDTENTLKKLGLKRNRDFRILLTRASPLGDGSKQMRFDVIPKLLAIQGYPTSEAIEQGTEEVAIVAFVGDSLGDKPISVDEGEFFCINQGGMYGDPCAKQGYKTSTE